MPPRVAVLLLAVFAVTSPSLHAQIEPPAPAVSGYVTAIDPSGSFDVSGKHIRIAPKATFVHSDEIEAGHAVHPIPALSPVFLGEQMDVFGRLESKTKTVIATSIVEKIAAHTPVAGIALIDQPPPPTVAGERVVRADGYLMHITPSTAITWTKPLTKLEDLTANVWVAYHGVQKADGTVVLDKMAAWPNTIKHSEDELRSEREYDPTAVDPKDEQGAVSKYFLGLDPKRIPPFPDDVLQARIDRIGQSLVPAYQKALPDSDPTKIHFRFQLVNIKLATDAWSLPSGIILVPFHVVERLPTDAQIAELLADNIAEILEKQEFLAKPGDHALTATNVIGDVLGIAIPGVGLVTGITTGSVQAHRITLVRQQSGRVSLWLMHDAGYDIHEAPLVWWRLRTKKDKPLDEVGLPDRAINLYVALGTTWRTTASH